MVAELEKGINWPWEGGTLTYQYLLVQICPNSPRLLESKKGTIPKFPWNHPSNWFTPNESLRITKSKSSRSQYFPPRIWFSEVFAPTKTRGIRGGFGPLLCFPWLAPPATSRGCFRFLPRNGSAWCLASIRKVKKHRQKSKVDTPTNCPLFKRELHRYLFRKVSFRGV